MKSGLTGLPSRPAGAGRRGVGVDGVAAAVVDVAAEPGEQLGEGGLDEGGAALVQLLAGRGGQPGGHFLPPGRQLALLHLEQLLAQVREFCGVGVVPLEPRVAELPAARADPLVQAQQFLSLCKGRVHAARMCNYLPELTDEQIELEVGRAVETFVAAFGA